MFVVEVLRLGGDETYENQEDYMRSVDGGVRETRKQDVARL